MTMRRNISIILALACALALFSCSKTDTGSGEGEWKLSMRIESLQGSAPTTKVSYSGPYGEHSEFETGDCFGLFVLDAEGQIIVSNLKAYCSGLDNSGVGVWSVFKEGSAEDNSSNYPLSEKLSQGVSYYAYFPFDEGFDSVADLEGLKSIVPSRLAALPKDQSASQYADLDFLVASNIEGCPYGSVSLTGRSVSLVFGHCFALFRFHLPKGAVKYDYLFDGVDFTPYVFAATEGDENECRYIFAPGCELDFSVKYVLDGKLYRMSNDRGKRLWPVTTEAGHCYFLDENAPKVPYSTAVDMGTSVMWADFNLGAEDSPDATQESVRTLPGTPVMWAVNCVTSSYGQSEYNKYNNSFTSGTKPIDLPLSYDFSSDVRYDAARNLWGGEWRTPTLSEWQELYDACTTFTDTENHTITFTNEQTGNSIILKFAGYYDSSTQSQPTTGYYWTSTAHDANLPRANSTLFAGTSTTVTPKFNTNANRYTGLPVRPVYSR